mgnify:FL=1
MPGEKPREYKLIAKYRVKPEEPSIDLRDREAVPSGTVAVEVKRALVKKLHGKEFTVHTPAGDHTYTIQAERRSDWHEFDLSTETQAETEVT